MKRRTPSPEKTLVEIEPLIDAVVTAVGGHPQAKAAVEQAFEQLTQAGYRIAEPIRRIWYGERDGAALTGSIGPNSTIIIREILKRLN